MPRFEYKKIYCLNWIKSNKKSLNRKLECKHLKFLFIIFKKRYNINLQLETLSLANKNIIDFNQEMKKI